VTSDIQADVEGFVLLERRADHPDAVRLLRAFYDEQVARYGVADPIDLDPSEYAAPIGTFLVGYQQNQPIACGGCRWYDPSTGTVEIKKTYLVPEGRGLGRGRILLAQLEAQAIRWGAQRAILETGVRNTAALALFLRSGYQPMACYAAGRNPAINRAFSKSLNSSRPSVRPPAKSASAL
jgi:GNAT superfamily N-acetyltransferase